MTLFSDIAAGNWHQARADFTDRMKSALDEEELAAAWAHVTAEAGAYQGAGEPAAAQASGLTNVCVPLRFDACVMEGCAAFDAQGKVAGLHFLLNTDGHGDNVSRRRATVSEQRSGHRRPQAVGKALPEPCEMRRHIRHAVENSPVCGRSNAVTTALLHS